jgi:hypothetical protein
MKLLIMQFLQPITSSPFGPNILLSTLFSNTLSLYRCLLTGYGLRRSVQFSSVTPAVSVTDNRESPVGTANGNWFGDEDSVSSGMEESISAVTRANGPCLSYNGYTAPKTSLRLRHHQIVTSGLTSSTESC